jgi:hypothetical protein
VVKKRGWLLCLLLVVCLVGAVTIGAGPIDLYPQGVMILSSTLVQFGNLRTEPHTPPLEYFEAEDVLDIQLITLYRDWQVLMSGSDFRSGADLIPLQQLEWKKSGGYYKRMKAAGSEEVIAKADDYGFNLHYLIDLSFRLVLTGNEAPGNYGNTMIFSMVFP